MKHAKLTSEKKAFYEGALMCSRLCPLIIYGVEGTTDVSVDKLSLCVLQSKITSINLTARDIHIAQGWACLDRAEKCVVQLFCVS